MVNICVRIETQDLSEHYKILLYQNTLYKIIHNMPKKVSKYWDSAKVLNVTNKILMQTLFICTIG